MQSIEKLRRFVLDTCQLPCPAAASHGRFGPSLAHLFKYLNEQRASLKHQVEQGSTALQAVDGKHRQLHREIQQAQKAHADKTHELAAFQREAKAHMASVQRAVAELASIETRQAVAATSQTQLQSQLDNLRRKYKTTASRRRALRARLRRAGGDCRALSRVSEAPQLKAILDEGASNKIAPVESVVLSTADSQADSILRETHAALKPITTLGAHPVRTATWDGADSFRQALEPPGNEANAGKLTTVLQPAPRQNAAQPVFQYDAADDTDSVQQEMTACSSALPSECANAALTDLSLDADYAKQASTSVASNADGDDQVILQELHF